MPPLQLHPLLDASSPSSSSGTSAGTGTGGTLSCKCPSQRVSVTLSSNVSFNHACGCSKCWKPPGALFSIVGVVPRSDLSITANGHKLRVVDPSAVIQRHACADCGVHLFGRIEVEHAFKGLDFVHVELGDEAPGGSGWQSVQFAAFVSSIVEQGFEVDRMGDVRRRFAELGLQCYDCLSPELMDMIAAHEAKKKLGVQSKL